MNTIGNKELVCRYLDLHIHIKRKNNTSHVDVELFLNYDIFWGWFSQVISKVGNMVGIKYFPVEPKKHTEENLIKVE